MTALRGWITDALAALGIAALILAGAAACITLGWCISNVRSQAQYGVFFALVFAACLLALRHRRSVCR